jgi:hypothetical protein
MGVMDRITFFKLLATFSLFVHEASHDVFIHAACLVNVANMPSSGLFYRPEFLGERLLAGKKTI